MYQNSLSLNELENKYGVIINHFPDELTKKMFEISETPFDMDGIIIDLWEIDLSPGIFISPFMPW